MKRIFVTHIISEGLIKKYNLATAACNFSFNLISGGVFDEVYSILPTNVGAKIDEEAFNDRRYRLVYKTSIRIKGRLCRFVASCLEQCSIYRRIPRESSIWLYNVTDLNIILIWLLKLLKPSVKINVIELDFTPSTKSFSMQNIFLREINNADGNIRLANSKRFTCKNSVILPGVVPLGAGYEPRIDSLNKRFLLSGVLTEGIAQTSMVLEAFSRMPDCELHITGFHYDDSLISSYIAKYPNIKFYGHTSFAEYLDIMHSCTYQLSTRDATFPENQCNFPSKIIESLLHNRIIISTIKYSQLDNILYFNVHSEVDSFINDIRNIIQMQPQTLFNYANQGAKVSELFSVNVWKEKMQFVENKK